MYTRVAVALDGSDRALEALGPAHRLCRLHRAALWLVAVVSPDSATEQSTLIRTAARVSVELIANTLIIRGVDPAAELARFQREHPDALLCLMTRARGLLGRVMFGSVAAELVRQSDRAIALVGPSCDSGDTTTIRRLLVCVDGTPAGEAVLPWATAWSVSTGVPLALVHVVYPLVDPAARLPPTEKQLDELAYVRHLARRLERDGHRVADVTVQHPSAADAIVDLAADVPGALIALAKPSTDFSIGGLHASMAARVLRGSTVPVVLAGDRAAAEANPRSSAA
jgi:nucleotide-binding universal stress UspA family protein